MWQRLLSVCIFLAVAVAEWWEVHQLDVNGACLHGELHEGAYRLHVSSSWLLVFFFFFSFEGLSVMKSCGLCQSPGEVVC